MLCSVLTVYALCVTVALRLEICALLTQLATIQMVGQFIQRLKRPSEQVCGGSPLFRNLITSFDNCRRGFTIGHQVMYHPCDHNEGLPHKHFTICHLVMHQLCDLINISHSLVS